MMIGDLFPSSLVQIKDPELVFDVLGAWIGSRLATVDEEAPTGSHANVSARPRTNAGGQQRKTDPRRGIRILRD